MLRFSLILVAIASLTLIADTGLSLNCLQCGNGGNFPDGQGCQGYEEGTSVLCPADSDTCMKSTCGLQSSTNIVTFKGCADSPDSSDLPCHIEHPFAPSVQCEVCYCDSDDCNK